MSKLRADSTWNELTPEQLERLEEWLLVERASFREVRERVQREFGVTCSVSSVVRFQQHTETERAKAKMAQGLLAAAEVNEVGGNLENLRASSLKLIGNRLLLEAIRDGDVKELSLLGRLVLESQERDIQQARLDLARRRFEYKATQAAVKLAPMLDEMSQEDAAREMARIDAAQRRLFGDPPEGMA